MALPEYTFVPWLRRGLGARIAAVDTLGAAGGDGPPGRPALAVELTLDVVPRPGTPTPARPSVGRDVGLLGPGDVASVKPPAILRTSPVPGTLGATPDDLAFVEFYDEDFPWRYTPARPSASRLRPWLALLVLTGPEFTLREGRAGRLATITLTDRALLPPVDETWAWAHAQISRVVARAEDVGPAIERDPDHARSRLLSPRRLAADTRYQAFLVPAFEAGRLAGLARPGAADAPAQMPSWGRPVHEDDRELPVYHSFAFRTATSGDFETLARRLTPRAAGPQFGKRVLDVGRPGFGLPDQPGATVGLEGALAPVKLARQPFAEPWNERATALQGLVDRGSDALEPGAAHADPIVVPPGYGLAHAGVARVLDARDEADLAWLAELNLDPRSRAAAGLGTEAVRRRQDELVQRAWEQVGAVEEANKRLREAELVRAAAQAIMRKHVTPLAGDDRLTRLAGPALPGLPAPPGLPVVATAPEPGGQAGGGQAGGGQAGGAQAGGGQVAATASVRAALDKSRVPAAAQTAAFRRVTRPQRPLMRRLGAAGSPPAFQADLLKRMDAAPGAELTVAPPAAPPAAGVTLGAVESAVHTSVSTLAAKGPRPFEVMLGLADDEVSSRPPGTDWSATGAAAVVAALRTRTSARFPGVPFTADDPAAGTLERRVWNLAGAVVEVAGDGPGRARLTITESAFRAEFSDDALGKARGAATVVRAGPAPPGATIGRTTALQDVQAFASDLTALGSELAGRADPRPALELGAATVAGHLTAALNPVTTIAGRIAAAVPVVSGRAPARRLEPVRAYPRFPDPFVETLQQLGQDFVLPNLGDVEREALMVMEPNRRFIESYLAGANFAFNQELLWREYPTDLRGTSLPVFWDTGGPPRPEIKPMDQWAGPLGAQAADGAGIVVLVVRGELLERFPSTVIFAQRARFAAAGPDAPRVLDPAADVREPVFAANLDPDIRLVGFKLSADEARGRRRADADGPADPGWFFVFMERPGEPRFGLDAADPPPALTNWDDLAWSALRAPGGAPFVHIAANTALAPAGAVTAHWGRTAADQASILLQSPVMLARHASEMLP